MKALRQKGFGDCGLTCVSILADHYGLRVTAEELAVLGGLSDRQEGLSLKDLKDLAETLGFEVQAVKASVAALARLGTPGILHCSSDHYVVLESADASHVTILDPAHGRGVLTHDELAATASGYFLAFADGEPRPGVVDRARRQADHLAEQAPWRRRALALLGRRFLGLAPAATLHGALLWLATAFLVAAWISGAGTLALAAVAGYLLAWVASLLEERHTYDAYRRASRELTTETLEDRRRFQEEDGGYRLEDRFRWLHEFLFLHRASAARAARLLGVSALATAVGLGLGDALLTWAPPILVAALAVHFAAAWRLQRENDRRTLQRVELNHLLARAEGREEPRSLTEPPLRRRRPFHQPLGWLLERLASIAPLVVLAAAWGALLAGDPAASAAPLTAGLAAAYLALATAWAYHARGQLEDWYTVAITLDQISFMEWNRLLRDRDRKARAQAETQNSDETSAVAETPTTREEVVAA